MSRRPDDFAAALRVAITASGLTLEQVRTRLDDFGAGVSVATLSYWQSGRRVPERAASRTALGPLEEVLGVPRGSLVGKVPHRSPEAAPGSGRLLRLPSSWAVVESAFAELGLSRDDGLTRVGIHDRLSLRVDGTERSHVVRTVFVARRDGVRSFPLWYDRDPPGVRPDVHARTNCRVGRTVRVPEASGVAVELVLDHELVAGESLLVEHVLDPGDDTTVQDGFTRCASAPLRELLVEIDFAPGTRPAGAESFSAADGGPEQVTALAPAPPLLHHVTDAPAGMYGVRWTW